MQTRSIERWVATQCSDPTYSELSWRTVVHTYRSCMQPRKKPKCKCNYRRVWIHSCLSEKLDFKKEISLCSLVPNLDTAKNCFWKLYSSFWAIPINHNLNNKTFYIFFLYVYLSVVNVCECCCLSPQASSGLLHHGAEWARRGTLRSIIPALHPAPASGTGSWWEKRTARTLLTWLVCNWLCAYCS